MYNIVERRALWFTISVLTIIPGLLFMLWSLFTLGTLLPLSIDFTGGTLWEIRFEQPVTPQDARALFVEAGFSGATVYNVADDATIQVRLPAIDQDLKQSLSSQLEARFGPMDERFFRSIGPTIGSEVSRAGFAAVVVASVLILLYLALAFRQVSHPFRYGTCAVIALVHDVLVTVTFVGIMYFVAGWEVDALFLTAILTVIGFSVHDTIVIFDRIRENSRRYRGISLTTLADRSIVETLQRSVATQVTVLMVLVAILVLGGATLRQFVAILIVGMVSGTYSSIFNAAPLLVSWDEKRLWPKREDASRAANGSTALGNA